MVPNTLFTDPTLELQDIRTWCFLCLYARGRDSCDVTDVKMAEDMGVNERTIKRSLARLDGAGFIRRDRRGPDRTIVLIPEGRADANPFTLKVVNAG
jgi:Mn-dependent DtxR family transcriptional regulator